jgi:hypothetical protein
VLLTLWSQITKRELLSKHALSAGLGVGALQNAAQRGLPGWR